MSTITKPQVPAGLRDLMKDLTREILKEKPTDIYDFAENYFSSRLPQKENYAVRSFENSSGKYDFSYIQNPQRYQVPVALVYSIIPEGLTNLIKELIKAVLREQPQNLCDFAVEYFRHIKAVTSTESQAEPKEINYSAYENYFMNKERFLFTPYVKCTCGRILGEAYAHSNQIEHFSSIHNIQNNDSAFQSETLNAADTNSNNVSKMSENYSIYSEKYMNAIYIIQTYIRRYLKRKSTITKTKGISSNHHSLDLDSMTTKTEEMPIVPQLQINQNEAENNSEDVSYTSASTALLSATESGRETSEPSTSESILTKTIIEGVQIENDDKNISDYLKQSANGHAQIEATTNNQDVDDNRNANVPERNVEIQQIDKGATELMNNTAVSKNEELKSINETGENPLARNDLEGKSTLESQKFLKSNEHGSIDSVIVSSINAETFGNDHMENLNDKELISKSEMGELPKKSGGIHYAEIDKLNKDLNKEKLFSESELNSETEVITKESSLNLAKEANTILIHSTNNIKRLVNKSSESLDKKLSDVECTTNNKTIKTCHEIEQTNSSCGSADNISEIVDKFHIQNINEISENEQKPILDKQKEDTIEGQDKSSKIEHRQSLDTQNVSIANENEGEGKTTTEEQKQRIDRNKDSIENETEHDKQKDSIMENNKSDLLEEIFETKMDSNNKNSINKSTNDLNQCSLDSNMESNADDANISNKFKNQEINDKPEFLEKVSQINEHENKKLDVANSTQNKSVIETSEANKTTGNDKQDMNLHDTSQTEQHEENVTSANTDNVSEVEKDFEKPETQANNSFNRNISSKLNNELIRPKINDDDENISAEVDTNDKIGAILASIPKDNADIPSSETKENFDKNESNTIEPKLETNLNNTQYSKENHDDSIKQDIANPNLLDNKNNAATIIGIKSEEITLEKSAEVDTNDTIGAILASNSKENAEIPSSETKENFDKNEINTRTEMDKIIKEHKLEINLNNTQDSKDDDSIKQDIANPNLLDNKNNAATIIGIKSEEITLEKSNETDTNLVKSSEVVSDKTKSCTSNFLEKQMDITHDKESGNEFEPKSEINEHLHEKGKDVETKHDIAVNEIETENKLEQTFKNELIEDMKTNNLNDTNVDIKLENQVDKSEHMSNVINEVIINKTVKDEMDLNQEETFQGDLNMNDNNTKNSINEDVSLKSQSEKPLLDSDETTTTKDEMDNKLEEVSKTKLCEINKTSNDILQRNLDMNKEKESSVAEENTDNDNQDTKLKDLHTIKDNSPSHESKHDEVDFKAFKSVKESNNLNDKVEVIHKTIQGIKLHESPTTMTLDEKNINTDALDDLKDDNQSIKSQSESERVKSLPTEMNDKHETVDKNKHEASITENSIEPTANDKVAKNIQQSFQAVVHEKNNNSDNVELNTEQQSDNNLSIEVAVDKNRHAGTTQKDLEEKTTSVNQTVDLTSENLSQKQQSESITSESAIEHTNEKTFQSKVESIENTAIIPHSDCNETNDVANALPDDNNNVENSNDTLEVSNQTESQENIYKNVDIKSEIQLQPKDEFKQKSGQTEIKTNVTSESQDKDVGIKSEPQFESNDELKQNTNLPKTLQTDPIETSYIIDDLSINYEKDDIKTNEKHELDKPLNKTKDKIVNNDDKEMSSTILEDKKDIKPKDESEISQTDVENLVKKSDKGDQNMNEPENLNTVTKSNSLQKPLQMMLSESKNITVESVGKTIKQETVNDPDNSTKITDQELDTNDINPINANDNIAETTNKGDQEKIPQGSSINELNYSNIITDYAIDKTFTESQENTYKNVDIKSEVQPQSNDELKQNTNLPKTLQTEPIETSYIIDDLSINCETDDIKTNEKHELDKPLNKTNDKIVINDDKEMSSTILEDKKDIKPKDESEISQTDVENLVKKSDKGDQNMNEPENLNTVTKSNSLQKPLQMMLSESNNITVESVDKTIKQETVNDPVNSTKITDQELDTNDINPINANDNISETTNKGDQEKIPQGSSINELNYSNIITDYAIDKTFTESQENTYKNVDIKSEVQPQSNDELKQNTNLPKTLQTEQIETSYIIDDLSINCETDDIKTNEKHELDKPLNKTNDKIVINDASEFKEMSSTILEDKKDIKPKVESEISQTDVENLVQKTDKGQNMNEPENSITINKSNSLQEPLQMMLSESNNITGESVDKTIKQETVNDPDNSTKITDQDMILSKNSKTELETNDINPINANDNIAEPTKKGDQEKIPQGSSINELNYNNIITDDAIDKTFTLKSAESTDKEQVKQKLMDTLQTKLAENMNNLGTDDSITDTNLLNTSGSGNVAQENGKNSSANDLIAKHDLNANTTEEHKQISDTKSDLDAVKESTTVRSTVNTAEELITKRCVHETQMERHKQISDTKSDLDEVKELTTVRSAVKPNESDVKLNSNKHIKAETLDKIPSYTEVDTQYMDYNNIISKTPNKQPEKSNNSGINSEKSSEEFTISEDRVKRETAIETSPTDTNEHDGNSTTEKLFSLSSNDNAQPQLEESRNGIQDKNLNDSHERDNKDKFENTEKKDIKEKHYEKSKSLSSENESERSFEKEFGTSKEEKSSSNVDSKNKLEIERHAEQNTATNESSGDIKNINTVYTKHQLAASNSSSSAIENNDDGEKKMFADDLKEDIATSTGSEVSSQLSLTKQDTTCKDDAQKQSDIFEIKCTSTEETAPEKHLDGVDKGSNVSNSYSIQAKYEQIDTTNSADEAVGSDNKNQTHDSDPKLESKAKMTSVIETVEKPQSPKPLNLETQETGSDSNHDDKCSSKVLNEFEITNKNVNDDENNLKKDNEVIQDISKHEESCEKLNEKTSISLNCNVVPIEAKQMENEVKNSNYNEIELNTNSEISSKNEQYNNNQHDRDNNTNEKMDKDSTTGSKNSEEFHNDSNSYNENAQHSNNDNKNDTNLENNEISLESEEDETRNYDGSNSEDKNDDKKSNQKLFTIQDEQISKFNENVNSNESKMIQQPDSITNSSILNNSKTLTHILNKEIASEGEANPKDYQLKSSLVNSSDIENNISSTMLPSEPELSGIKSNVGSKTSDLHMNKLQPSIIEVQQQNSAQTNENVTIKLEDGETNANENTESSPLENKAKTEVSNPLVHDSSTTKHIEEIESSNTAINKLNVSNVGNIHEDLSYSSTKNEKTGTTNNDELHPSAEIVNIDSNPNIPNSEQLIKINNESNNNNITNKDTHISIDDQTPLAADESKNLNIIKDHSTLTSNELKGSVMGSELQDISNQSQVVADAPYINNNDSLTHSKSEGIICNETSLKETHSDDHNNMISDGNGITRSIDTLNETKLITKDKTMDTSSELNLSNHTANVETTIDNEIKHENFDQEITGQTNTDVKGEHTNEQVYIGKDTTHNIGIQTPETFIGNQNFNIGRIRNFNEGLLGSISGQRFAETHLKSFWKEYVMNNSIPLSQYDYKENEPKEQTMTGSVHEINKARLADTKNEEQIIDIVEPEILKENITQMESSPTNNHNIYRTSNDSNPPKDIERIPRYFYGVPDTVSNDKASHSNQKSYKEPTSFTINMGESNKVHTTKIATSIEEESSTKPNTEVVFIKDDKKLSLSKLNLVECADAEPLLDAETPTKLFQDLHEFEYNIHDVDLDITYTIDEIIRLRIENDSQHNSDNDEHLNEFSEYSLTPEPMLQTIIELSESETPKPPDLLHSIDDDFLANLEKISDTTSTSWTTGSKEDNSFISDEFLDEKHNGEYLKATPTNLNSGHETQGGIYEFAIDEMVSKEIQSQNEQIQDYEHIIEQAPTPPNNDPFYEDLKETAAKSIQRAYRQYKQKRILKAVESIDTSENSVETPDKKYHQFHNIDNDANSTSHDEVNNTKCNELKDQASIENNILKKEAFVTASINRVISQEKPTEIENYKETGEKKIKQLVENSDDCGNESESISKEHRNNRSSIGSDRNEYINKTKSSSNNINSESKQESIVQEHLNVIILQTDLNSTEDDIDCSENKTHDLSKTVDETDSGTTMSNSNSEKQKFETINILPANCDINDPIEKIKDSISNITDANIKVNNKNSNDSESIETNVSENIRYINNMNQNSSNSETNTENQNNNKSNELLKSSNSSKIESINNEITNPNCNSITNTVTSFDINNVMKEESGEINETKHDLSIGHFYFEPTAPAKEDIQSVVSQENIKTNQIIQDQAARKIQRAFKHFIEQKSKLSSDLETKTESSKSNWFVGDEPIIANDSLTKTTSEISFEETEAYVELNNPSQYLVGSSSNLETIDANNFSRSPTAPVSNRSRNSVDLANNPSTNISKDTVSVIGTGTGIIENANTEHTKQEANTLMNEITSNEKQLAYKNEKAFKYTSIIDQFINVERHYSDVVNHHNKEIKFTSPDIAEITKILSDFTDSQKAQCDSEIPYERLEEPCIKKSASRPHNTSDSIRDAKVLTEAAVNTDTSSSSDIDDTEDSLSTKTVKLHKTEMAITKMQQRRDSTTKVSNLDKPKDYNFEEPLVAPMDNLDTDEEGIVINKLNREETRESSGQSDVEVIIGGDKDDNFYFLDNIDIDETFPSKGSLKRVHTIAGDGDAKSLLKNVTIDESIKYIEPPDYELNSGSLCLDDDTAENIRRKMMAYSLSEADSDCFDKAAANSDGTNSESKTQKYDDFNVSTALVENGDSSTETESTIVSAVTKIQAGARGYLTRKRLGKTSIASDGKSIPHDDINKVSFGNAAINESLEHLVQEAAAKRIQNVYRQHYRKRLAEANRKDDENLSPEFATSMENTLAQKRSII
ncbi:protein PF3D7_1417600 [Calliphora vicina]|uniref:protein PF3D7_1417600 n=1 Tax=Calliphora vicina TaxID=7373 RepID=UPI00325BF9EB